MAGKRVVAAGVGCRRGCPGGAVVAAVRAAEAAAGTAATLLAVPAFKRHEPGLAEAAALLHLPLRFVDDAAMRDAQPRCSTRSATTAAATGFASVAEAAALAASGGRLLLPRLILGSATCALAVA